MADRPVPPPPDAGSVPDPGQEIVDILAGIFRDELGVTTAGHDSGRTLKDLGVDSLSLVEFVAAAEERFALPIGDGALTTSWTLDDVAALVVRKRARKAESAREQPHAGPSSPT